MEERYCRVSRLSDTRYLKRDCSAPTILMYVIGAADRFKRYGR